MALITWSDAYSVNVAEIDQQHKKLVAMINDLNDAMKQGKGKDLLGGIVNDLIRYTATHFKTEESYFDRFGYPEADSHKEAHAAFVQKVSEFKAGFETKKLSLTIEVMRFLSDWLTGHIQGTDRKYGPFFNANGLN